LEKGKNVYGGRQIDLLAAARHEEGDDRIFRYPVVTGEGKRKKRKHSFPLKNFS